MMDYVWIWCNLLWLLCGAPIEAAPYRTLEREELDAIPNGLADRYIVTLWPERDLSSHLHWVQSIHDDAATSDDPPFQGVTFYYNISTYQAYAGHFSPSVVEQLRHHHDIESVELDQPIYPASTTITQPQPPYGLQLISHRGLGTEKGYRYDSSAGTGTYAYVVDTGIDINNSDFGGRAFHGHLVTRNATFDDHVGHGTHVAGIIGSQTWGVAKRCELLSVKVMNSATDGAMSDLLEGIDWAVKHIVTYHRVRRAVINVSLNGPFISSINKAVDAAYEIGVLVVAAAGNFDISADHLSPASAAGALTVGATDQIRSRAKFSNFGTNVTMFAPGVEIESTMPTWKGRDDHHMALSGTSMAAPFVAGTALYFQSLRTFANAKILKAALVRTATRNVVADANGSPNLFAYTNGGSKRGL